MEFSQAYFYCLAAEMEQPIASVHPSVRLFPLSHSLLNRLTFELNFFCVGHDHSSHAKQSCYFPFKFLAQFSATMSSFTGITLTRGFYRHSNLRCRLFVATLPSIFLKYSCVQVPAVWSNNTRCRCCRHHVSVILQQPASVLVAVVVMVTLIRRCILEYVFISTSDRFVSRL